MTKTLSKPERDALDRYDAWVDDELGAPTLRAMLWVAAGLAAMLIITVVVVASRNPSPESERTTVTAAEDDRTQLTLQFDGVDSPDDVQLTIRSIERRLDAINAKHGDVKVIRHGTIVVDLKTTDAKLVAKARRLLLIRGRVSFAIEATASELRDGATGLGSTFEKKSFVAGRLKPCVLYANPTDFTKPKGAEDKPRFQYVPRWGASMFVSTPTLDAKFKTGKRQDRPRFRPGTIVHVRKERRLDADEFKSFTVLDDPGGRPVKRAEFEVHASDKDAFRHLTRTNKNRILCMMLDDAVVWSPIIKGTLPGCGVIDGISRVPDLEAFTIAINAGAYPTQPTLVSERMIGER